MSEMKHDSAFQGEMERQMEEHRVERAKAAKKSADQVADSDGFPITLADGSSVMIVNTVWVGQRVVRYDADGQGYARNFAGKYEAVASPTTIEELPAEPVNSVSTPGPGLDPVTGIPVASEEMGGGESE